MVTVEASNTILYCDAWAEVVTFYRDSLGLVVLFANEWFVEFGVTDTARVSVADAARATIASAQGAGITLTFKVADVDAVWRGLQERGVAVAPVRDHAWGARVCYLSDPEGNRLEFWSAKESSENTL